MTVYGSANQEAEVRVSPPLVCSRTPSNTFVNSLHDPGLWWLQSQIPKGWVFLPGGYNDTLSNIFKRLYRSLLCVCTVVCLCASRCIGLNSTQCHLHCGSLPFVSHLLWTSFHAHYSTALKVLVNSTNALCIAKPNEVLTSNFSLSCF